jgi:hypothetical protein
VSAAYPQLSASGWDLPALHAANRAAGYIPADAPVPDGGNLKPERVITALSFLDLCRKSRKPAHRSSYGLKHIAERWAQVHCPYCLPSVANGELIAAALWLGYKVQTIPGSTNAAIWVSNADVNTLDPHERGM